MSSYTTLLCYAVDSVLLSHLLNQADAKDLVAALRAANQQKGESIDDTTAQFDEELEQHVPWLEKIMARIPAKDPEPFGEDDDDEDDDDEGGTIEVLDPDDDDYFWDDEPLESDHYLDAFEWLCETLGKPMPISESLNVDNVVTFHYYGYTEALKRFPPPFPLPQVDDAGLSTGFVPHDQLTNFQFKPIDPSKHSEIKSAVSELELLAADSKDDDMNLAGYIANRAKRNFVEPIAEEIELAHDDLGEIFLDVHRLGKDFIGLVRIVG